MELYVGGILQGLRITTPSVKADADIENLEHGCENHLDEPDWKIPFKSISLVLKIQTLIFHIVPLTTNVTSINDLLLVNIVLNIIYVCSTVICQLRSHCF